MVHASGFAPTWTGPSAPPRTAGRLSWRPGRWWSSGRCTAADHNWRRTRGGGRCGVRKWAILARAAVKARSPAAGGRCLVAWRPLPLVVEVATCRFTERCSHAGSEGPTGRRPGVSAPQRQRYRTASGARAGACGAACRRWQRAALRGAARCHRWQVRCMRGPFCRRPVARVAPSSAALPSTHLVWHLNRLPNSCVTTQRWSHSCGPPKPGLMAWERCCRDSVAADSSLIWTRLRQPEAVREGADGTDLQHV
eukprot:366056-Chlamydomonas_euryale.AAC.7